MRARMSPCCGFAASFTVIVLIALALASVPLLIVGPIFMAGSAGEAKAKRVCHCIVDAEIQGAASQTRLLGLCDYPVTWGARTKAAAFVTKPSFTCAPETKYLQNVTLPCTSDAAVGKHVFGCLSLAKPSRLLHAASSRSDLEESPQYRSAAWLRHMHHAGTIITGVGLLCWGVCSMFGPLLWHLSNPLFHDSGSSTRYDVIEMNKNYP